MNYGSGNIQFVNNAPSGGTPTKLNLLVLPVVTDIATVNNTAIDEILVTDTLRGGSFLKYSGAQTDDQGVIFTDANGQLWKRVLNDYINFQWYGAIGVTVQQFDSYPSFVAAMKAGLNKENIQNCNIYVPGVTQGLAYYFSQSVVIDNQVNIFGDGESSVIAFNANLTGFTFNNGTSNNSIVKNIALNNFVSGTPDLTRHGFDIKALVRFENVTVQNASGNGFNFVASTPTGNTNNSQIINCTAIACRLHGFYVQGSDANHMNFSGCSSTENGGCGFADDCFLGNSHNSWHTASNGSAGGNAYGLGCVQDGTNAYQALQDNFSGQPLSNTDYWLNLGSALVGSVPAFNIATVYYREAGWFLTDVNQACVLVNCYAESDQCPNHTNERVFVLSGLQANINVGLQLYADQNILNLLGGNFQVNDSNGSGIRQIIAPEYWALGSSTPNQVAFSWVAAILGIQFGNETYLFGPDSTAAMQGRTNVKPGLFGFNGGFLFNTPTNRNLFNFSDWGTDKPTVSGLDLGDFIFLMTNAGQYFYDKPEVIGYRNWDGTNMIRVLGFAEYEFNTTDATPYQIFSDSFYDHSLYNSKYEIDILAVNTANGDVYAEKRIDVVNWMSGATPPPVNLNVKNSVIVEPVFQETTLVGCTVTWNTATSVGAELSANGLAGISIHWKIQIKRIRL